MQNQTIFIIEILNDTNKFVTFAKIERAMNLRENIKYILERRGMTQVQLAAKMGVSKQQMQYYINGNTTIKSLQKIAIALDTTMETLVSEVPLNTRNEAIPTRHIPTASRLVCPICGGEFDIIAKA